MIEKKHLFFIVVVFGFGVLTYVFPFLNIYFFNPILITILYTILFYVGIYSLFLVFSLKKNKFSTLIMTCSLLVLKIMGVFSMIDLILVSFLFFIISPKRLRKNVFKIFLPVVILSLVIPNIQVPFLSEKMGLLFNALDKQLSFYSHLEVGKSNPYFYLVGFLFFLGGGLKAYASMLYLLLDKNESFFELFIKALILTSFFEVCITLLSTVFNVSFRFIPVFAPIVTFYAFYSVSILLIKSLKKQTILRTVND